MTTHEKALEAAARAKADLLKELGVDANSSVAHADGRKVPLWQAELEDTDAIISAYLSALTPPDVAGLVERLGADVAAHEITGNGDMKRVRNVREAITLIQSQAASMDFHARAQVVAAEEIAREHRVNVELTARTAGLEAENALLREREGWKPIESAPKDKTRVILAWTTPENLPPHIELGYWSDIKASWVNTYGNQFSGSPDIWFAPPSPASPSYKEQKA